MAKSYDAVIQLDSDITIDTLDPILEALETHDIVTTYTGFKQNKGSWIAQQMTMLYRNSHEQAQKQGKINMEALKTTA